MSKKRYILILTLSIILGISVVVLNLFSKQPFWNISHSVKYLFLSHISMAIITMIIGILFTIFIFIFLNTKILAKFYYIYKLIIDILSNVPSIIMLAILGILIGMGRKSIFIVLIISSIIIFSKMIIEMKKNMNINLLRTAKSMNMNTFEIGINIYIKEHKNKIFKSVVKSIRENIQILIFAPMVGVYSLGTPILLAIERKNIELVLVGALPIVIMMVILTLLINNNEQ